MARTAADLSSALDVIAGPDEYEAMAYRVALPAPRHGALKDFRVLVLDSHPLLPVAARYALSLISWRTA
jgi:amidase